MKKLKIKIKRVGEVVVVQILQQDKSTYGIGSVFKIKSFEIGSGHAPSISSGKLFLRGPNKEWHNKVVAHRFSNEAEAIEYVRLAKKCIKKYNKHNKNIDISNRSIVVIGDVYYGLMEERIVKDHDISKEDK